MPICLLKGFFNNYQKNIDLTCNNRFLKYQEYLTAVNKNRSLSINNSIVIKLLKELK